LKSATLGPPDTRAWLAHGYLMLGYWLPASLVTDAGRPTRFEAWLARTDSAWRRHATPLPRPAATLLELAYLLCYPAVPFAFVVAWTLGSVADVDRFWVAVLGSGFLSYGWLPWLVSRPPRTVVAAVAEPGAGPPSPRSLAALNAAVLRRISHQFNTFPSGHVAVSVAASLSVLPIWLPGGVIVSVIATGVVAGAVAGRYHYLVDVVLGIAVGIGCAFLSRLLPPAP
jgi:hypothetical protein